MPINLRKILRIRNVIKLLCLFGFGLQRTTASVSHGLLLFLYLGITLGVVQGNR